MAERQPRGPKEVIDIDRAKWKQDRRPPPPADAADKAAEARARTTIARINQWLDSGVGDTFSTLHEAEYQADFPTAAKAKLEAAGFTVTFQGNKIFIEKTE